MANHSLVINAVKLEDQKENKKNCDSKITTQLLNSYKSMKNYIYNNL